jgi:antitoxin component of MazEF toxin-antitoxin module
MYRTLRQQGNSIGFTVPSKLARAWDLRIGDAVRWEAEGDTVTLKFFRLPRNQDEDQLMQDAPVEQEAVMAAE